jgi:hypothetical protein
MKNEAEKNPDPGKRVMGASPTLHVKWSAPYSDSDKSNDVQFTHGRFHPSSLAKGYDPLY